MNRQEKKLTVMHVVENLEVGGMENGVVNLANMIDGTRFQLSILCLSHPGKLAARITNPGILMTSLNWTGGFRPGLVLRLARIFRNQKIDIVHSHGWLTYLYGSVASKMTGVPVFINGEHGTFHLERIRRKIAYRFLSGATDRYLTVSASLKEILHRSMRIPLDRIVSIPNGVDPDKFSPRPSIETEELKRELRIPRESIVLGTVGRLEPVKNYAMLIRAFAELQHVFPALQCVLVGEGSCEADLKRLAREAGVHDRVHFIGRAEDVPCILSIMDIFALSSFSEGMSNTILEAMACGKPVVATDVGGNREMVVEGSTGFLVSSGDAAGMAKAIESLVSNADRRIELGKNARALAVGRFGLKEMVHNYERVYIECMRAKKGRDGL